ncbi:hypothetical protein L6452_22234 [Arctium lappa]|uniref:Uncharacterized protein n=1 Tax=Arctium lappa TaxID=4217 RepID=A0ACB9B035_ARCLA|nr:hypothetical protein L6452_22234 [Arctium lappa]
MMKSLYEGPMVKEMKVIPATSTTPATAVETPLSEYDEKELSRYKADSLAKSNLILALPNSIYNIIDCFKHNPMLMWTQLDKIMLGTAMSTQLRHTRFMNNFEKFQAKDGESLKSVFDRFWAVINDLFKIKVTKTELEANLKFLNALQPEWNKACHRIRNDVRISTMPIQELYEILMTDESMVMEKKAKMDKKNKPQSVDPIALIANQLVEQTLTESAYDGSTNDDGEALEKAMTFLTQLYQKRFKNKSGSNNLQFTSGSKTGSSSKTYTPKYEQAKRVDQKKDDKKVINCFNCGKPRHMLKDCRVKRVKNADFYRKKLALAEKNESGTVLLVEEEYWLDHSDNEADNEEVASMCFVGDDQSDDEEDDTSSDGSEVISDFNYNFFLSQINVFILALHDLHSKLVSEKFKNQEKSDFIEKLQISLKDEKSILIDIKEKFQKQLVDHEKSNQTYRDSLTDLNSSNKILSEKIIVLERKLYKREQSEQTIYMNKPRSEEAIKDRWGLDRTVRESSRKIWRKKRISEEYFVDEDKCMPKCTRLKDVKEHTHVKMPMSTMLKDANEHTSHDTCFALHTWPAKLVLRIKHDTQTLLCVSSMARKSCFASPMWNANLSLRFLHGTQTTPVFSVSLILQIFRCLVSNIRMTKLIKIIKVMRVRSQGEVKETKSLNVYLLIKIRSKILFSDLQQNLLLFLLRTLQFIQDHSK